MVRTFTDMLGRQVTVNYPPRRIVSLVPSQTELLADLGLEEEVTGITKFCVHPEVWFRNKRRVGGTKQLHMDIIAALQPDLVIANKEENERAQIELLTGNLPVWISDIKNLADALTMIRAVGEITGKAEAANSIATDIANGFAMLQQPVAPKRVIYFMWHNPWMCAGGDTFIGHMIKTMGWRNVIDTQMRYPEISLKEMAGYNPEIVLLSSEPYPFKEKHIAEIKAVLPDATVLLVDGEMFSWYGSRLLKAIPYLSEIIAANP